MKTVEGKCQMQSKLCRIHCFILFFLQTFCFVPQSIRDSVILLVYDYLVLGTLLYRRCIRRDAD